MKEGMKTFRLGFPQAVRISSRRLETKQRLKHFTIATLEDIARGSKLAGGYYPYSDVETSMALEIIKERTAYCSHSAVVFVSPVLANGGESRRAICKFCQLAFSAYRREGKTITYTPFYSKEVVSYNLP